MKLKIILNLIESKKSTSELAQNIVGDKYRIDLIHRELTTLKKDEIAKSFPCDLMNCERWKACKHKKQSKTGSPGKCWQLNDNPNTFKKIFKLFNSIPPMKTNEERYRLRDQFNSLEYTQRYIINFFLQNHFGEPFTIDDVLLLEKLDSFSTSILSYLRCEEIKLRYEEIKDVITEVVKTKEVGKSWDRGLNSLLELFSLSIVHYNPAEKSLLNFQDKIKNLYFDDIMDFKNHLNIKNRELLKKK